MTIRELYQFKDLKAEIAEQKKRLNALEKKEDSIALTKIIDSNLERYYKQYVEIEIFISCIEDSYIRRIIRLRFIDDLSWQQIANKFGGGNTADSLRKACVRYLQSK